MNLRIAVTLLPTPAARDWKSGESNLIGTNSRPLNEVVVNLFPTPKASDGTHGGPNQRDSSGRYYLPGQAVRVDEQWLGSNGKDYGPAVRLWEETTGHLTPCPTESGTKGNRRLSPAFSEWMMGLEPGWVTDIVDNRNDALHVIGNGVVPRQAEAAFRFLMDDSNWSMDDMSETKDKPRGECTGCKFEYQLSTSRSGVFKGQLVTRKHNSRTGPGLCEGAQKPPAVELGEATGDVQAFADPAPVAEQRGDAPPVFYASFDSDCSCGNQITEGDLIQADREDGYVCTDCIIEPDAEHKHRYTWADDDNGHSGSFCECGKEELPAPNTPEVASVGTFADPAPMPAEMPSVSGQPEPDRDRWGRYKILGVSNTRATSFAKLGSSTYALGEWNERMLINGLVKRPDLLAMAHGLDVKRDRDTLNSIADQAQEAAGNKVAANIGTAYHSFTERLDAGLCTLDDVPEQWRARCAQYTAKIAEYGLTTRREWIERTTAVRADQVSAPVPVAGTLDRIFQLPDGSLCIGDLKTGSNLDYSWAEIAVQLAIYAHGVNTHGLFDWNTKTWQDFDHQALPGITKLRVRTDYAIVMHLPADGDGCTLYRVDLVKGWEYAQVSGTVQARQKDKSLAGVLTPAEIPPQVKNSMMERASRLIDGTQDPAALEVLLSQAKDSGQFSPEELEELRGLCAVRWQALNIPY